MYRFYRGGALLGRLRDERAEDGPFPEDWVASVTPASNPGRRVDPEEGLTRLADGRLLRDAIESGPAYWLGPDHVRRFGATTGLLVKLLDSAERLPVHAHPDRAFAREQLASEFGKTEAWFVIATREETAAVWVGLLEGVDAPTYRGWIERQEIGSLLGSLNRLTVRVGDVVYVPAGVPHAIGAGVLIAELQEPTDFSILCEWRGFPVRAEDTHLGLGWERAITALNLLTSRFESCRPRRPRTSGRTRCPSPPAASPSCSSSKGGARSTACRPARVVRSRSRRRATGSMSPAACASCAASHPFLDATRGSA